MSKKLILVTVCVLLLLVSGFSQSTGQRYIAPNGEFSYIPPDGWVLREVAGLKYKAAVKLHVEELAPNINIGDEFFSGTLDAYVTGNLRVIPLTYQKMGVKDFRVLSQSEFITDLKQRGIRVITESIMGELNGRQTFYFFDGESGKKFVVTCTVLARGGEGYDKLLDSSMKTFKAPA